MYVEKYVGAAYIFPIDYGRTGLNRQKFRRFLSSFHQRLEMEKTAVA
jgi:hypothetical protein